MLSKRHILLSGVVIIFSGIAFLGCLGLKVVPIFYKDSELQYQSGRRVRSETVYGLLSSLDDESLEVRRKTSLIILEQLKANKYGVSQREDIAKALLEKLDKVSDSEVVKNLGYSLIEIANDVRISDKLRGNIADGIKNLTLDIIKNRDKYPGLGNLPFYLVSNMERYITYNSNQKKIFYDTNVLILEGNREISEEEYDFLYSALKALPIDIRKRISTVVINKSDPKLKSGYWIKSPSGQPFQVVMLNISNLLQDVDNSLENLYQQIGKIAFFTLSNEKISEFLGIWKESKWNPENLVNPKVKEAWWDFIYSFIHYVKNSKEFLNQAIARYNQHDNSLLRKWFFIADMFTMPVREKLTRFIAITPEGRIEADDVEVNRRNGGPPELGEVKFLPIQGRRSLGGAEREFIPTQYEELETKYERIKRELSNFKKILEEIELHKVGFTPQQLQEVAIRLDGVYKLALGEERKIKYIEVRNVRDLKKLIILMEREMKDKLSNLSKKLDKRVGQR